MQDLRQGNYIVYDWGIRPTSIRPCRIAKATDTESTWFEVRIRRESSLVTAVTYIIASQVVTSIPPQTIINCFNLLCILDTIGVQFQIRNYLREVLQKTHISSVFQKYIVILIDFGEIQRCYFKLRILDITGYKLSLYFCNVFSMG